MSDAPGNQRAFQRYQSDFTVSVALPQDKDNILETATVRDISGGGLSFISRHAGRYALGQQLMLRVHLPAAGHAPACMQGAATVVRIGDVQNNDEAAVSLHLDQSLSLDRPPRQLS